MRILDLFCGAGGAAMGYRRVWPDARIVGVDLTPQPNYPFDFVQADALTFDVTGFDFIHASPPCQAHTVAKNIHGVGDHLDLIPQTRALLGSSGVPYVIENVPGAPLVNYVVVCGRALMLDVKRHRLFESNMPLRGTKCPKSHPGDWVSVFGHTVLERGHVVGKAKGGGNTIRRRHLGVERGREAMGIDWMNRSELSQAIPPRYTAFLGHQLAALLMEERAA